MSDDVKAYCTNPDKRATPIQACVHVVNCYMCQKVAGCNRETKALRKRPCHPEPDNKRCVRANHIKNAGSTIAANRPVNS